MQNSTFCWVFSHITTEDLLKWKPLAGVKEAHVIFGNKLHHKNFNNNWNYCSLKAFIPDKVYCAAVQTQKIATSKKDPISGMTDL